MGRKSKSIEKKKGKLSITISIDNYNQMETKDINKSKLINWLLEEYFNGVNDEKTTN